MKRLFTLLILVTSLIGNVMAWEPVIKETHWFGVYEYEDYYGNFTKKQINWQGNYLESLEITKEWTGQDPQQAPKTSLYSWLDHQLRFSVSNKSDWSLDMNNNSAYNRGIGLKNISGSAKDLIVHHLNAGDQLYIRYYQNNSNQVTEITQTASGGTFSFSIPANAVVRCLFITMTEYQKAGTEIRPLTSEELNDYGKPDDFGYRYSFTGSGVLEDKQGAVPYITMKFGADNDMTFVRALPQSNETGSYQFLDTYTELDGHTVLAKDRGGSIITPETKDFYGSYYYTVNNSHQNDAGNAWACQFWIGHPDLLNVPAGAKVRLQFRRHADDHAQNAVLQAQGPGAEDYISGLGTVSFSKEEHWVEDTYEYTVTEEMAGKFQYFTFNLNTDNSNNTFNFADIHIFVQNYQTQGDANEIYGAASVIDANNNFNPDVHQYHIKYKINPEQGNEYPTIHGTRTETDLREMFIGKEWSVFTAPHAPESVPYIGGATYNGQPVVWRDMFLETFPLFGNFFFFYPEVDGKLIVDYYCEGAEETPAFWWKTAADGTQMTVDDQWQMHCKHHNVNNDGRTSGNNNYWLEADVKKGCVYYFCSLPTNNQHEHPILRVKSYSFIPSFRVSPLTLVVNNTTDIDDDGAQNKVKHAAEIFGGPYQNLNVNGTFTRNGETLNKVRYFGNVQSADVQIETEGDRQFLTFEDITFIEGKNPGGAIVVHLSDACGEANFVLTIGYDAVEAKWGVENGKVMRVQESGTEEVKHWDFYNNTSWDLGKYSEGSSSKLWREINKEEDKTADWNNTFVNLPDSKEPIFKSVYDIEADNVDMIHETEGLVIHAPSNTVGVFNENDAPETEFQDRFIGFMPGSKLVIPRLKQNDRVVIKMGTYGNADETLTPQTATLTLNNAKDAKGNTISGDYVIGGSVAYPEETAFAKTQPHGEYHFMVANTSDSDDDDFSIELKEGDLLKIYSIVIYRNAANNNADILTENSITTADGPELLFTDEDVTGTTKKDMEFYLRYSGFEEPKTFGEFDNSYTRGNLNLSSSSFTAGNKENSLKVEFTKGDFGSFRADAQVMTQDDAYVTDYTPGSLAVGNLDKMEYPYTWDFTDLLNIQNNGDAALYILNAINAEMGTLNRPVDFNGWIDAQTAYGMRNAPIEAAGVLFANGGQLYGANVNFEEIAGIGFKRSPEAPEKAKFLNESLSILSKGIELNCMEKDMFHKLVLPKVPAGAVIYVRAAPVDACRYPVAQFSVDGETGSDFNEVLTISIPGSSTQKDKVYIMKNDAEHEQDVELWLNGMSVKKIAVSEDFKKIGSTGYATESRTRVIDHRLTEFFTGVPIKAYYGKLSDDKKSVSLEKVEFLKAATAEGDATGCILHNETTGDSKSVDVIDGGFHLFVPDMHDKGTSNIDGNVLLAHLSGGKVKNGEGITRYVLTNKWYSTGDDGKQNVNTDPMKVRFVKVDHSTGATLSANSAYMELSKDAGAKIANIVLFYDEKEEPSGETTGIVTLESDNNENAVWYTLSGMRIEAPAKAGMYIRNGKKVVVRMK